VWWLLGGQLARRYGLPYRSSNTNAANTLDAQAAYDKAREAQANPRGPAQRLAPSRCAGVAPLLLHHVLIVSGAPPVRQAPGA